MFLSNFFRKLVVESERKPPDESWVKGFKEKPPDESWGLTGFEARRGRAFILWGGLGFCP